MKQNDFITSIDSSTLLRRPQKSINTYLGRYILLPVAMEDDSVVIFVYRLLQALFFVRNSVKGIGPDMVRLYLTQNVNRTWGFRAGHSCLGLQV